MKVKFLILLGLALLTVAIAARPADAQFYWRASYRTPHLSFNIGSGAHLGLHHIYRYPLSLRHFHAGPAYSIGLRPYSPVAWHYYPRYYAPRSWFYHGYAPLYGHVLAPPYYSTFAPGFGYPYGYSPAAHVQQPQPTVQVIPQTQVIIQNNLGEGAAARVIVRQGRSWDSGLWRAGTAAPDGSEVELILDSDGRVIRNGRQAEDYPARRPAETVRPTTPAERDEASPPLPRQPVTDSEAAWLTLLQRGNDDERRTAARELTRFPTRESVLALVEALKTDGAAQVRQQSAHTLGVMLAFETLHELRHAARTDPDSGVRAAALTAAQKIETYYRLG
jgi:hypothetical protein